MKQHIAENLVVKMVESDPKTRPTIHIQISINRCSTGGGTFSPLINNLPSLFSHIHISYLHLIGEYKCCDKQKNILKKKHKNNN